ncbi:MAG: threonine synthase [Peptostreptococcaceae bacterium]|nr:threonine synthase [Peptostreptococcaceae bacterium]
MYAGLIHRYRKFFDIKEDTPVISLSEGRTPLIRAFHLEEHLRFSGEIYLKFEGLNPTGSFKDRGMTLAVTKAVEEGSRAVICASTGNTSASAAAYAARAGLQAYVIIPDGKIAKGKLAQAIAYGACIIAIDGNFDAALRMVREISERHPITMVNSLNPHRIEGQKTASFEICDELGDAPDRLFLPVGNAGNITAYWKGFKEYLGCGLSRSLPVLMGYQAYGAAPLVLGHPVEEPETIATAIRIGNPASSDKALQALAESKGQIDRIRDEDILKAQSLLARLEGIFAEPASCISIAGLILSKEQGLLPKNGRIVCVLTGNGLKDSEIVLLSPHEEVRLTADYKRIEEFILSKSR